MKVWIGMNWLRSGSEGRFCDYELHALLWSDSFIETSTTLYAYCHKPPGMAFRLL